MIVLIIQSFLGLNPVAPLGFAFIDPHLPPWLPDLRLQGVRIGNSEFDFALRRAKTGETRYRVNRRLGRMRIVRMPPPEDPRGTPLKRLGLILPGNLAHRATRAALMPRPIAAACRLE
ncbi:MAG: hypothetical protein M0R74_10100 [Dehalococcoidia bacterium]|nr:hypothetical protein [Dehalococcoidia bacterium]